MPLMLLQVISIPAVGALDEAGFDREVEALCTAHYASGVGRPGVPPGRYFRMLLVGYFEGLESERGIAGAAPTACHSAVS